ncbi:hypothetical protein MKK75_19240 [Methylobacterium sp. J-030]|uniref:hypothetical protein n=1 Tax=Methylobacterium sp. J-030 TaxID=2836627 RepID=UPI001FB9DD97|nr:hypothetical protein [Methylobacterium sp. J-030]MCJ2070898.1 hypothetical protein [Methylobacterium sp. J-030]
MPEKPQSIFLPSTIEEVVAQIADLPLNAYDVLRADIQSLRGFESDKTRCDALARKIPISAENISIILSALSYLYSRVNSIVAGEVKLDDIVERFISTFSEEELEKDKRAEATYRLKQLLVISPEIEQSRKIRRLKSGFLQNATAFSSFVDARPDFGDNGEHIRGFVVMVQFRVSTDGAGDGKKEHTFQVDEEGLGSLRQALEAAEKKIKTLRRGDALVAPVYKVQE